MKKHMIFALLFLVFTACAPQPTIIPNTGERQTTQVQGNLANRKWQLVSFGEPGEETPVVEGSTITLEFNGDEQAVGSGVVTLIASNTK